MKHVRIPIRGWKRCVHEAAAFESNPEYIAACLFDDSKTIAWWLRNDPAILRIPSPVRYMEPDFVYLIERSKSQTYGMLEVKGGIFWDGEGSIARIQARAACEWVRVVNASGPKIPWEFAVVLEQDVGRAKSIEELRHLAILSS